MWKIDSVFPNSIPNVPYKYFLDNEGNMTQLGIVGNGFQQYMVAVGMVLKLASGVIFLLMVDRQAEERRFPRK